MGNFNFMGYNSQNCLKRFFLSESGDSDLQSVLEISTDNKTIKHFRQ